MRLEEVSKRYQVLLEKLWQMEQAGLFYRVKKEQGVYVFSDEDIQLISRQLSLLDLGLRLEDIHAFLLMEEQGSTTLQERKQCLLKQRKKLLCQLHEAQKSLDDLDAVVYKMEHSDAMDC